MNYYFLYCPVEILVTSQSILLIPWGVFIRVGAFISDNTVDLNALRNWL